MKEHVERSIHPLASNVLSPNTHSSQSDKSDESNSVSTEVETGPYVREAQCEVATDALLLHSDDSLNRSVSQNEADGGLLFVDLRSLTPVIHLGVRQSEASQDKKGKPTTDESASSDAPIYAILTETQLRTAKRDDMLSMELLRENLGSEASVNEVIFNQTATMELESLHKKLADQTALVETSNNEIKWLRQELQLRDMIIQARNIELEQLQFDMVKLDIAVTEKEIELRQLLELFTEQNIHGEQNPDSGTEADLLDNLKAKKIQLNLIITKDILDVLEKFSNQEVNAGSSQATEVEEQHGLQSIETERLRQLLQGLGQKSDEIREINQELESVTQKTVRQLAVSEELATGSDSSRVKDKLLDLHVISDENLMIVVHPELKAAQQRVIRLLSDLDRRNDQIAALVTAKQLSEPELSTPEHESQVKREVIDDAFMVVSRSDAKTQTGVMIVDLHYAANLLLDLETSRVEASKLKPKLRANHENIYHLDKGSKRLREAVNLERSSLALLKMRLDAQEDLATKMRAELNEKTAENQTLQQLLASFRAMKDQESIKLQSEKLDIGGCNEPNETLETGFEYLGELLIKIKKDVVNRNKIIQQLQNQLNILAKVRTEEIKNHEVSTKMLEAHRDQLAEQQTALQAFSTEYDTLRKQLAAKRTNELEEMYKIDSIIEEALDAKQAEVDELQNLRSKVNNRQEQPLNQKALLKELELNKNLFCEVLTRLSIKNVELEKLQKELNFQIQQLPDQLRAEASARNGQLKSAEDPDKELLRTIEIDALRYQFVTEKQFKQEELIRDLDKQGKKLSDLDTELNMKNTEMGNLNSGTQLQTTKQLRDTAVKLATNDTFSQEALKLKISDLETAINKKNTEIEKHRDLLIKATAEQGFKEGISQKLLNFENELKKKNTEIEGCRDQQSIASSLGATKNALKEKISDLGSGVIEENPAIEKLRDQLSNERDTTVDEATNIKLSQEPDAIRRKVLDFKSELCKKDTNIERLGDQLNSTLLEATQNALKEKKSDLESEFSEKNMAIETLCDQLNSGRDTTVNLATNIILSQELDASKKNISDLESKVNGKHIGTEKHRGKLNSETDTTVNQATNIRFSQELNGSKKKMSDLESELSGKDIEMEKLRDQLNSETDTTGNQATNITLRQELMDLENEVIEITERDSGINELCDQLNRDTTGMRAAKITLIQELDALRKKISDLVSVASVKETKIGRLCKQKKFETSEEGTQNASRESISNVLNILSERYIEMEQLCGKLNSDKDTAGNRATNYPLIQELNALKMTLLDLENELNPRNIETQKLFDKKNSESTAKEDTNDTYSHELNRLRKKLFDLEAVFSEKNSETEKLRDELSNLIAEQATQDDLVSIKKLLDLETELRGWNLAIEDVRNQLNNPTAKQSTPDSLGLGIDALKKNLLDLERLLVEKDLEFDKFRDQTNSSGILRHVSEATSNYVAKSEKRNIQTQFVSKTQAIGSTGSTKAMLGNPESQETPADDCYELRQLLLVSESSLEEAYCEIEMLWAQRNSDGMQKQQKVHFQRILQCKLDARWRKLSEANRLLNLKNCEIELLRNELNSMLSVGSVMVLTPREPCFDQIVRIRVKRRIRFLQESIHQLEFPLGNSLFSAGLTAVRYTILDGSSPLDRSQSGSKSLHRINNRIKELDAQINILMDLDPCPIIGRRNAPATSTPRPARNPYADSRQQADSFGNEISSIYSFSERFNSSH